MTKLRKEQVGEIKERLARGETQLSIASIFMVSRSVISDIATNRIHKDVLWPEDHQSARVRGGQRKNTEYDPTDERVQDLESEVVSLRDELLLERRKSKAGAREGGIYRAIVEEMDKRVHPFRALPSVIQYQDKVEHTEHVVMHLSDGHHDQVVRPEEVGGLEDYNFPVSCCRAERYVDTVIKWTQSTLSPKFNFPVLWILAYGDFTSGEIHGHTPRSYYRNIFRNCFAIGQLHALMFRDLAAHFPRVNVLYLAGNHGRRTQKKDFRGPQENWDYLCAEMARLHCQDLENVTFMIPDAWSANVDINGVGFNISHGDDVRSQLGIPWYGMVRRQKGLVALGAAAGAQRIRYFCVGHHHTASTLSDIDGELVVNGAWIATDQFTYNALAGYREPAQWLHGVSPRRGITWRLNCKLRHPNEKLGPKRYKIDAGRDVGPIWLPKE